MIQENGLKFTGAHYTLVNERLKIIGKKIIIRTEISTSNTILFTKKIVFAVTLHEKY